MLNGDPTKYTSQEMNNSSFDELTGINTVEIVGADGIVKNPATEAKQDDEIVMLGSIAGFNIPEYDTIEATYPTGTTEVFTYKKATATVGVITVAYSDSTKEVLISVTKS